MDRAVHAIAVILHAVAALLLLASRGLDDVADKLKGGYIIGVLVVGIFIWALRPAIIRKGKE